MRTMTLRACRGARVHRERPSHATEALTHHLTHGPRCVGTHNPNRRLHTHTRKNKQLPKLARLSCDILTQERGVMRHISLSWLRGVSTVSS